jgi:TPR repeat protein
MMMRFVRTMSLVLAMSLLLAACGDKVDKARIQGAEAAYRKGDFKTAREVFQAMSEQGNARAQFYLGEMYLSGSGVAKDYAQALKWASAAAEQKSPDAQYTLGMMYESGKGVAQDYVLAHMWYSLSGTSGDEQAIRKKAELELRRMTASQIEQSKQMELKWIDAHNK